MSELAIRVENLSKVYRIGAVEEQPRGLRQAAASLAGAPFAYLNRVRRPPTAAETFWALRDVSFEVKQGEVVGIIGRNGAGKSTLLKILSRITEPSSGQAQVYGRIASLLEVGTGFHPELTGRENIYLNGAILGMRRAEIDRKFDEIVDFSGVEQFLDTPVKRYSSGMYVRLAFAVAAHLEPEILLVDEVLAVGDAEFQKKCLGKMGEVAREGRTVLFVSHIMAAVENLCHRGILFDKGRIVLAGTTGELITRYLDDTLTSVTERTPLSLREDRTGNGIVRLTSFGIEDSSGTALAIARSGSDTVFAFGYEVSDGRTPKNVDIGFSLHTQRDQTLFVLYSSYVGDTFDSLRRRGVFRCTVPRLPLGPGRYRVGARVTVGGDEADWPRDGIGHLDVESGDFYGTGRAGFGHAPILVAGSWEAR